MQKKARIEGWNKKTIMNISENQLHSEEAVSAKLSGCGILPTRQRVMIGRYMFAGDKHMTAEQLMTQLNNGENRVSKATIYNTLGLFARKGLLREVVINPGRLVYDTNTGKHHHIYNLDTGELSDIPLNSIKTHLPELDPNLQVEGVDIVIRVQNKH